MALRTSKQSGPRQTGSAAFQFESSEIKIDKLLLDPNNYRFLDTKKFKKRVSTRFHEDSVQRATLEALERSYQLDELKQSILVNGYVPMERIIVSPYQSESGFFLVVEGNRRVASLKSLLKDNEEGVLHLGTTEKASFQKIPCAVLESTGATLKHAERVIMGIRHIAGPKEWGAYQQALLVSELKDEEGQEFKEIGDMLGSSGMEAARRYRAIGALKAMENDELFSRKAEPSFYRLFHELVSLPKVRETFGWSSEQTKFTDVEKARSFFALICSDGRRDAKLLTYSDVRKLKSVIGNNKAEEALFDPEQPLTEAFRIAEQGKKSINASGILKEAKESLAQIGVLQARTLKQKDVAVIDELIGLLKELREIVERRA
jgi:hypothetical protein